MEDKDKLKYQLTNPNNILEFSSYDLNRDIVSLSIYTKRTEKYPESLTANFNITLCALKDIIKKTNGIFYVEEDIERFKHVIEEAVDNDKMDIIHKSTNEI